MGKTTVGYAYHLDFAYTFCEQIDSFIGVFKNGKTPLDLVWGESAASVPPTIKFQTGDVAKIYGSDTGPSTVKIYDGTQVSIPEMFTWTALNIGYKNTCTLVFPQAFIGDNVQAIPQYAILGGNNAWQGISNYQKMWDYNANPIDIIYNILIRDLQMDPSMIDAPSFHACAYTVYSEGLSVGLLMGNSRKVSTWIEDMLAVVDGVIFTDSATSKVKVKLLRADYDINTIVSLNDDNISKLAFEGSSWAQTYNKFVLKYTYIVTGKETSVEYINTAARQALGYDRTKTIEFPAINGGTVLAIVAKRLITKLGTPLAGLKISVDYIDFPNVNIGDVIKFSSVKLGLVDRVFRIIKISGDNEEKSSIQLDCLEDIFCKSYDITIPDADEGYEFEPADYSLTPPKRYEAKDAQREMALRDSVVCMATKGARDEFILSMQCEQIGGGGISFEEASYATLATVIPADITGLDGALVSNSEYNPYYTFELNDVDLQLFEYFGTNLTLQSLRFVAYIGDEEFSFKSMENIGGGKFRATGVMRGLNDTTKVEHPVGTPIFIGPEAGRFVATLPVVGSNPSLQFNSHNHVEVSTNTNLNINYNYTISKPYNPVPHQSAWGATKIISWQPRVALAGANYRSESTIVCGADEGKVTGYYEITFPNSSKVNLWPTNGDLVIEQNTTQTGTHYIKHINSDTQRYDTVVSINIT